jgi:Flp pilus assembly protein TadB
MFGLNKIGVYLFIGMMLIGSLTAAYYGWKRSVEQQALMEFNQKQMEQTIKDQKAFTKKQQEIAEQQAAAAEALAEQNRVLSRKISSVNTYLSSKEAADGDRPSSDVLKKTVEQLQQGQSK